MELLYRAGRDHGNADGMSPLPDMVELCRGYKAGEQTEELSCGGVGFVCGCRISGGCSRGR